MRSRGAAYAGGPACIGVTYTRCAFLKGQATGSPQPQGPLAKKIQRCRFRAGIPGSLEPLDRRRRNIVEFWPARRELAEGSVGRVRPCSGSVDRQPLTRYSVESAVFCAAAIVENTNRR